MKLETQLAEQLLSSPALSSYFNPRPNPYKDTIFEHYYLLNNKIKGAVGEKIVEAASTIFNRKVDKRTNPGHDSIIDGIKTEVKVSLAMNGKHDVFTFNHLATQKDYDRILLVGLSLTDTYMVWLEKTDFINFINQKKYFKPQQGGKKADNDDYLYVTLGSWQNFINEPCVHDFSKKW